MAVDPAKAKARVEHGGKTYFFCSIGCSKKFSRNPETYFSKTTANPHEQAPAPAASRGAAIYTCPMHPEVARDGPGACPICGMALEPRTVTAEEGPNLELLDMTRRFWVSVVFAAPLFLLAMSTCSPASRSTECRTWARSSSR